MTLETITRGVRTRRAVRRWPLYTGLPIAALTAALAAAFGSGLITVYDAPGNAGVVVGWECHNAGYEWRGAPGFFTDSCS